ncbi:MAG: hypothetical protein M3P82_00150, partial [Bacteroidota bacterium]|nr:hypothetical protein [Bacteroidota bacterium]
VWGIYRSTNAGTNWENVSSTGHGAGIQKIIVFNNTIFAATYGRGVKKSTDNGATWEFSNIGLGNDRTVNTLMVSGNNLYAGVFVGIYLSTDNGSSWVEKNNGIFPGTSVFSLVKTGLNLLAGSYTGSNSGLYLSTDNAASWNIVQSAPPKIIHDFVTSGTEVYAASDSGVYRSINGGSAWEKINSGLTPDTRVMSIIIHKNYLYIGTYERGVWKRSFLTNVQNFSTESIPDNYNLQQNYPNPFNPVTTIKFDIMQDAKRETLASRSGRDVSLIVYDALGKEVASLVNETLSPGSYEVEFKGNNFSSGIYFYRISVSNPAGETNGFVQTKRMILIK